MQEDLNYSYSTSSGKYDSFSSRFLFSIRGGLLVYGGFCIFFFLMFGLRWDILLIFLPLLIIDGFISYKASIFYIEQIKFNESKIYFEIKKYSQVLRMEYEIKDIKFEPGATRSIYRRGVIHFFLRGRVLFGQYQVGEWDRNKLIQLAADLKKVK